MDATLLKTNPLNALRGDPGPEVDAAWKRISNQKIITLTREDVIRLGKDPARSVKWPEHYGFGKDKYVGRLDVMHQIHCLNAVRQEAYFNHYFGAVYPDGNTTELHKLHLSHCIYYLLQNIMCTASADVYTHTWTDTLPNPYPEFSVNHQCRSFDTLLDWHEKNGADEDLFWAMRKPDDYGPARNMTRKFKEIFNYYDTHEEDGNVGDEIG
jgi:hypothetical protein